MILKLDEMMKVLRIERTENTLWECLDLNILQKLLKKIKRSMNVEEFDVDCDGNEDSDSDEGNEQSDGEQGFEFVSSTPHSINEPSVRPVRKRTKSVRFDETETVIRSDSESSVDVLYAQQLNLLTTSSVEKPGMTSVYRKYVENTLKKTKMKTLRTRLKALLDGTLQRAKHALLKSPICQSGMPEVRVLC